MNLIYRILFVFTLLISSLHAEGELLNVGVQNFDPPYVMQGSGNGVSGFDIDTMNFVCKSIKRNCQFRVMRFKDLLNAVITKKVDVAIGTITITEARAALINFSLPYLVSYSRFLGNSKAINQNQAFSLEMLNNKRIGITKGSIGGDQLKAMGIIKPQIKEYDNIALLLEALAKKDLDYVFFDTANANYWAANSAGAFTVQGPPYLYGLGYGIAINKSDNALLAQINAALLEYQNSEVYKINYNKYLQF